MMKDLRKGTKVLVVLKGRLYLCFILSNPGPKINATAFADPPINDDVLPKAFQVDKKMIDHLQKQFWWDNN
ncbi:hypothetical protein H5410_006284 [Solanum commersonii]|uniref:Uncharacterized protein n=1 Tax=Solanum commersonii TaxID=4109 RepID=A0A9J6A9Z5_SOLCO|nr:hypothetical protein H5410_006284 [Solanum commersonii]